MKTQIRNTTSNDFKITELLTRETFWNLYVPGCREHLVLNQLRSSKSYIPELDMVAVSNNTIVGHIISTQAKVVDASDNEYTVLCVGPLAVWPERQKPGSALHLAIPFLTRSKY